jgi:hypothetical protein
VFYTEHMAAGFPVPVPDSTADSDASTASSTIPERGTPVHRTLTASTVETVDLDANYPAVEVVAVGAAVHALVDPADGVEPGATSGHYVAKDTTLALRSSFASTGASGVTRIRLWSAGTPQVIVTGLV